MRGAGQCHPHCSNRAGLQGCILGIHKNNKATLGLGTENGAATTFGLNRISQKVTLQYRGGFLFDCCYVVLCLLRCTCGSIRLCNQVVVSAAAWELCHCLLCCRACFFIQCCINHSGARHCKILAIFHSCTAFCYCCVHSVKTHDCITGTHYFLDQRGVSLL